MTVDVATLVFEFKSDSALQAEKAMDRLIQKGEQLDTTAKKVRRATDMVNEGHRGAAAQAERSAQGAMALASAEGAVERAVRGSARASAEVRASRQAEAAAMRELVTATKAYERDVARTAASVERLRDSVNPLAAAQERVNAELREAARLYHLGAISADEYESAVTVLNGRLASVDAIHRKAGAGARLQAHELANLGSQFADIGVSLASGQKPWMVAIQQGAQIGGIYGNAAARGATLSTVMGQIGGVAGGLVTKFAPVLLVVGAATAAFALFEREVDKNTKGATTFGDTMKATVKVVGDIIMDGPIGTALKWLGGAFGATLDAIVDGVMWWADQTVGFFGAAYETIVKNWKNLPAAFGVIIQGAANTVIAGVEGMINRAITGLNVLLKAAKMDEIGAVVLPRIKVANAAIAADFEKTQARIAASFKKDREGIYDRIVKQTEKEAAARQKAKKGAADHAAALSDEEKAAKRAAEGVADYIAQLEDEIAKIGMTELALGRLAAARQIEAALKLNDVASAQRIHDLLLEKEALEELAGVVKATTAAQADLKRETVAFESTPASLATAIGKASDTITVDLDKVLGRFFDIRSAADDVFDSFRNRDWASAFDGLIRAVGQVKQAFSETATTGDKIGAVAGIADAAGRAIGGKGGRALSSAANAGFTAFTATGNPYVAAAAAVVAGLSELLKSKPSNQGAGYSLVTGAFSGKSRTADTEQAARAAGDIIAGGQDLLRSAGLTLTETIHGLVIGSRDLSQVYTTGGRTVTAAVGDVAAAAEAGLRAVLETATFASVEQEKVARSALAAGKSFDEVMAVLEVFTNAQAISGNLADQILQMTDPKAFDLKAVTDDIAAQRKAYAALATEGYLTADQLATINEQLGTLETLRLDDVMKRYAEAVDTATESATDNAEAARRATEISRQRLSMEAEIARLRGQDAIATGIEQALTLDSLDESLHATQQLLWAEQKLAEERKLAKEAADLAAETARREAAEAQAKTEAAKAAMIQAANDNLATAKSDLINAYQRERAELEATESRLRSVADGFRAFRRELDFGSIAGRDPIAQLAATRREFNRLSALGPSNPDRVANLQGISQAFIQASQAASPTQRAFERDLASVRRAVEASELAATAEADVAKAQLGALTTQVGLLVELNAGVMSVASAINNLRTAAGALSVAQGVAPANDNFNAAAYLAANPDIGAYALANGLDPTTLAPQHYYGTGQYEIAAGLRVRGYAAGGMHPGGLRLVGEHGPEIEATGPARYYSAGQTAQMMGGDSEVITELRRQNQLLEEQNTLLREGNRNTKDTSDALEGSIRGQTPLITAAAA